MARDPRQPVDFREWNHTLDRAPLSSEARAGYRRAIIHYLAWCKREHSPASVASAQVYLEKGRAGVSGREALRWFFRTAFARQSSSVRPPTRPVSPRVRAEALARELPPRAACDLGAVPWEQKLIKRIRELHYLWRTEQTYRAWSWRFAQSLGGRSPETATEEDVRAFLSRLAVVERVAASTQKQALNAVVFLLREALAREVGDFGDFDRAKPHRTVPVVLSPPECRRLFDAMNGTFRLMAELAYGAGLRLNELLRLRVKDVDFERRQLLIYAGKGAKDRATVLPEQLIIRLTKHVSETVRAVFD